jgi:hypothetical protein
MTKVTMKAAYDGSEPKVYYAKDISNLLGELDRKAEAGLCYFTLTSAREFLKDIRRLIDESGIEHD